MSAIPTRSQVTSSMGIMIYLGLAAHLGKPPAESYEEETPVVKELGRLAFDGVADELKNPPDDEKSYGQEPEAGHEQRDDEERDRQYDERDPQRVAQAIDGMLMALRVLRDPVIPGPSAKHGP